MDFFTKFDRFFNKLFFNHKTYDKLKTKSSDTIFELEILQETFSDFIEYISDSYKEVVDDIQYSLNQGVPLSELQYDLSTRDSYRKILTYLSQRNIKFKDIVDKVLSYQQLLYVPAVDNHIPNREDIYNSVIKAIENIIDFSFQKLPIDVDLESLKLVDDIGMDSLEMVELLTVIEEEYRITVNNELAIKADTIRRVIDLVLLTVQQHIE